MKALTEGLLSGVQGAVGAADQRIKYEREKQDKITLIDLQHQRQIELEELKQQFQTERDAENFAREASLIELEDVYKAKDTERKTAADKDIATHQAGEDIRVARESPQKTSTAQGPKSATQMKKAYEKYLNNPDGGPVREIVVALGSSEGSDFEVKVNHLHGKSALEIVNYYQQKVQNDPKLPHWRKPVGEMKVALRDFQDWMTSAEADDQRGSVDLWETKYEELMNKLREISSRMGVGALPEDQQELGRAEQQGLLGGGSPNYEGYSMELIDE